MVAFITDRPIRIGIVEENRSFRCTLHSRLDTLSDLKVVAEAVNGDEALAMVEYLHPDVVLMSLPGIDGVEMTRMIRSRFPGTKVIILSVHTAPTITGNAFQAGACRVLPKDCGEEELVHTIRECSTGPSKIVGHPPHS
jgi:DNA-binding NarL/FixJ family response regulator